MTAISSLWKMPSKARLNFVSRSWIRNRGRWPRSSRSISRLRACWAIHAVLGLLVQARYSTLRVPIETKKSTYNRRRQTVSTVKKSQASTVSACCRRNERQLSWSRCGAGGMPERASTVSHQRRRDGDPELAQLADDPNIAPVAVLAREPQDELAHLPAQRRSPRPPVRIGPVTRDDPSVPAQQRLRCNGKRLPRPTRQHPTQRRQYQPVACGQLRPPRIPP